MSTSCFCLTPTMSIGTLVHLDPQDSFMVDDSQTNNFLPLVALSFELEGEFIY